MFDWLSCCFQAIIQDDVTQRFSAEGKHCLMCNSQDFANICQCSEDLQVNVDDIFPFRLRQTKRYEFG